jgi:hypothetical protein
MNYSYEQPYLLERSRHDHLALRVFGLISFVFTDFFDSDRFLFRAQNVTLTRDTIIQHINLNDEPYYVQVSVCCLLRLVLQKRIKLAIPLLTII